MINDRGKIKWQSAFFMPEHVKLIRQIPIDEVRQRKPEVDEQEFEEIGIIVMESLNYTVFIKLTVWRGGFFRKLTGIVAKVDMLMKYILFEIDDNIHRILIEEIIAAERE
ncbi:YolD-like family protein [Bacillus sp. AK031]